MQKTKLIPAGQVNRAEYRFFRLVSVGNQLVHLTWKGGNPQATEADPIAIDWPVTIEILPIQCNQTCGVHGIPPPIACSGDTFPSLTTGVGQATKAATNHGQRQVAFRRRYSGARPNTKKKTRPFTTQPFHSNTDNDIIEHTPLCAHAGNGVTGQIQ